MSKFLAALWIALLTSTAFCDRLIHTDGTVIEGDIINQNEQAITVKTQYGTLRYQRMDILRVERGAAATTTTASAGPAVQSQSVISLIPAGPINPLSPPNVPSLAQYHVRQQAAAAPSASIWTTTGPITSLSELAITE